MKRQFFYEVTILNEEMLPVGGISTPRKDLAEKFRTKAERKGLSFFSNFSSSGK